MRQRYLLGRYARERYIEDYKLLSPDLTPGEVYIQSTDVLRTIQSGYSELLGLYPPGAGAEQMADGEVRSLKSGKGMPPMQIRDADRINNNLGFAALPEGFVSIPVLTYINKSL